MKKHLFLIATAFATLSLNAQAFFGGAQVKIKSGAFVFIGGDAKFTNYANGGQKVSNEGKVKIAGEFKNESSSANAFVNEFVDTPADGQMKYGQLIIVNDNTTDKASGKMTSVIKMNSDFVLHSLAVPYTGITAEDLVKEVFSKSDVSAGFVGYNGGGKFDKNRLKNALFYWDNPIFSFTQLAKADKLNDPTRYYAVNTKYSGLGALDFSSKKSLTGVPANAKYTVKLDKYFITGGDNKAINKYGEAYGSYIIDFTTVMPEGWDQYNVEGPAHFNGQTRFGDNIFDFANPYTSNIDLTKGNGFPWNEIKALVQYGNQNYTDNINESKASGSYGGSSFSAMTGDKTGDTYLKVVRPFQTFAVKTKKQQNSFGDKVTFTFDNDMKTFEADSKTVNTLYNRGNSNSPVINQVRLKLYDSNGFTGVKTYVVASDIYKASQKGEGTEVYNISMKDSDTGIYTLQEAKDGSIDESLANGRTYINGVNTNYVAKPIHLVFQNGKGKYTLKAELNEDLVNSGKSFWFEDKETGDVQKVGKDFAYTFNIQGTDKDRFVLYWAEKPNKVSDNNLAKETTASATQVYKDTDKQYKVRFGNDVKDPSVFVYNISGQLVNVARNISTSSDYTIPVNANATVYIVKIVGTNGKVITKKIVK